MAEEAKKQQNNSDLEKKETGASATGAAASPGGPPSKPSTEGNEAKSAAQPTPNASAQPAPNAAASIASLNFEDGVLSAKLPVLLVTPCNETLQKLGGTLAEDELIRVQETSPNTAPALARQLRPCLMIASIVQSTDVVKYLTMLKPLKEDLKSNRIKFILLSNIKNPAIMGTFQSFGCHEYIIEPINARSLSFKIGLQTKALKALRKKLRNDELRYKEEEKKALEKAAKKKNGMDPNAAVEDQPAEGVQEEEAQESADNVWVFRGNKPKKQGGKWTMRMKGPDPGEGEWLQVGKNEDGSPKWRFMDKEADPKEAAKKKGWEWSGDKPTFTNGEWNFNGEKPELSLVDENGKKQMSKVRMDGDGLVAAKDSADALKKQEEKEKQDALAREAKKMAIFGGEKAEGGRGLGMGTGDPNKEREAGGRGIGQGTGDADKKPEAGGRGLGQGQANEKNTKIGHKGLDFRDFAMDELDDEAKKNAGSKEGGDAGGKTKKADKKAPWQKSKGDLDEEEEGKKDGSKDAKANAKESEEGYQGLKDKTLPGEKVEGGRGIGQGTGDPSKEREKGARGIGQGEADGKNQSVSGRGIGQGTGDSAKEREKDARGIGQGQAGEDEKDDAKKKKKGMGFRSGVGALDEDEEGEGKNKRKLGELADMAMDFSEEGAAANNKLGGKDGAPKVGGKNNAKTEHLKTRDWGGHDLTPEEMLKRAERERRQKELRDSLKNRAAKSKAEGEEAAAAGEAEELEDQVEGEDSEDAGEGEDGGAGKQGALSGRKKNFLKKKKKKKNEKTGLFEDSDDDDDEDLDGGWSAHKAEAQKKRKWGARDSENDDGPVDERDQLVEIETPSGVLKVKKTKDDTFEFPHDFFGSENGLWESAGGDSTDKEKRKVFVFVVPELRQKKVEDVRTVKNWWIFHGDRPQFIAARKVWVCRKDKPKNVQGFENLPPAVREYLLSISPHTLMKKKLEKEEKLEKTREEAAEKLEKAKKEFKQEQEEKAAEKRAKEDLDREEAELLKQLDASKKSVEKEEKKEGKLEVQKDAGKQKASKEAELEAAKKADKSSSWKEEKNAKTDSDSSGDKKEKGGAGKDEQSEAAKLEKENAKSESSKKQGSKYDADLEFGEKEALERAQKKDKDAKIEKDSEGGGAESLFKGEKHGAGDKEKLEGKAALEKGSKKDAQLESEELSKSGDKSKKESKKHAQYDADLEIESDGGPAARKKKTGKEDEASAEAKNQKEKPEAGANSKGAQGEGETSRSSEAAGEDEQTDSPLDEALADKAVVPLPSGPMMAVFVTELLFSCEGHAMKVLNEFAHFLSTGCRGVAVTVLHIRPDNPRNLRVVGATHEHYAVDSDVPIADNPGFERAISLRETHYPSVGGPVFCPIRASGAQDAAVIGVMLLEPMDTEMRFSKLTRYLYGVAQCLRGTLLRLGETEKEAA